MPDPQPVPINAKFDDDFVTQLVIVLDTDTMREVAAKVAQHVVGKRQPARDAGMVVRYQGRSLPPDITVSEAGIAPLQNVYVDWVESAPIRPANDASRLPLRGQAGRVEKGGTP